MDVFDVSSSKAVASRWDDITRTIYLGVGIVEPSAPDISLKLAFKGVRPGIYPLEIRLTGNNFEPTEPELMVVVEGASLGIEQSPGGQPVLLVTGTPGSSVRVEWRSELGPAGRWLLLESVSFSATQSEHKIPVEAAETQRFYRVFPR